MTFPEDGSVEVFDPHLGWLVVSSIDRDANRTVVE